MAEVSKKIRITCRRVIFALLLVLATPIILFVINGTLCGYGETPFSGATSHSAILPNREKPVQVKILAYNIAKGFAYKGGLRFEAAEVVRKRMDGIAALIKKEQPDLVFLSETILECGPCPVNQVSYLAQHSGMHAWVFGENYNLGLPFYRIIGGNAILSRWPIEVVANPSLPGRKPFYVSKNNRRVLWAAVKIAGERVLLASIHNDSFDLNNNMKQMKQILKFAGGRPTILAGDFNAGTKDPPIQLVQTSERFAGAVEGAKTFPANQPNQRIDFIFAPADWELINHRVLKAEWSDHLPVVSVFDIQLSDC